MIANLCLLFGCDSILGLLAVFRKQKSFTRPLYSSCWGKEAIVQLKFGVVIYIVIIHFIQRTNFLHQANSFFRMNPFHLQVKKGSCVG